MTDAVLRGRRVTLRPFGPDAISERYLAWLNDPEVNRFSRRLDARTTRADAEAYLRGLKPREVVYAIEVESHGHVGNVKYGPIDWANGRADISIMIGERATWGSGIGREAVYLVSRHLFESHGLNRLDAGSANPGFLRMVQALGWQVEGVLRQRVRLGNDFVDWTLVALLREAFARRPEFEPIEHAQDAAPVKRVDRVAAR